MTTITILKGKYEGVFIENETCKIVDDPSQGLFSNQVTVKPNRNMKIFGKDNIRITFESANDIIINRDIIKKKGGIQPGGCATSEESKKIDKSLKDVAVRLKKDPDIIKAGLSSKKGTDWNECGLSACEPDGHLWYWNNTLIAAFEAKYQKDGGNANERAAFNEKLVKWLGGPDTMYMYFISGPGLSTRSSALFRDFTTAMLIDGNIKKETRIRADKTAPDLKASGWNTTYISGVSVYGNNSGAKFNDDDVYYIMKSALLLKVKHLKEKG